MRLPRERFTLRRTMVLIAMEALLIAGERIRRRVANFRRLADSHAVLESTFGQLEQDAASGANDARRDFVELDRKLRETIRQHSGTELQFASRFPEVFTRLARNRSKSAELVAEMMKAARDDHLWAVWHGRMKERYRCAMWRPWEAAGPAPTPPKPLPEGYDPDVPGSFDPACPP